MTEACSFRGFVLSLLIQRNLTFIRLKSIIFDYFYFLYPVSLLDWVTLPRNLQENRRTWSFLYLELQPGDRQSKRNQLGLLAERHKDDGIIASKMCPFQECSSEKHSKIYEMYPSEIALCKGKKPPEKIRE